MCEGLKPKSVLRKNAKYVIIISVRKKETMIMINIGKLRREIDADDIIEAVYDWKIGD